MAVIAQREYESMFNCIEELYNCADLEQFPLIALTEINKLVGAESSTFNYLAPCVPKVVTVATPAIPNEPEQTRRFAQYLPEHAVLNHFLTTGNPGPFKLSDFQSVKEYHALPLYAEFYREIGYEDQLSFFLFPPGAELIGVSLARNRRNFTERDRKILDLLRSHLGRAFRHVQRVTQQTRVLSRQDRLPPTTRVSTIRLDAKDRPEHFGPEAQQWIADFFPKHLKTATLPPTIAEWLRISARKPTIKTGQVPVSLVQEREGQRLRLSIYPRSSGAGRTLLLGLEIVPEHAHKTAASKLTSREIDVMLQVERGKTNKEVSAVLGISPLTVRCHLERIFEKLKVQSRTAAVIHFRELTLEMRQTSF
jgi:DNA-binding CsgD family transcriptional regulator